MRGRFTSAHALGALALFVALGSSPYAVGADRRSPGRLMRGLRQGLAAAVLAGLVALLAPASAAVAGTCPAGSTLAHTGLMRIVHPRGARRVVVCDTLERPFVIRTSDSRVKVVDLRRFETLGGTEDGQRIGFALAAGPRSRRTWAVAWVTYGMRPWAARVLRLPAGGAAVRDVAVGAHGAIAALLDDGVVLRSTVTSQGLTVVRVGVAAGAARPRTLALSSQDVLWRTPAGGVMRLPLQPVPACAAGKTLATAGEARVFDVSAAGFANVFGCLSPTGPAVVVYRELPDLNKLIYGDLNPEPAPVLTPPYTALTVTEVADPDAYFATVVVTDLRDGATRAIHAQSDHYADSSIGALAVGADGTVAYRQPLQGGEGPCPRLHVDAEAVVVVGPDGRRRTLDCVAEVPKQDAPAVTDLRIDGATVSWTALGSPRTAALG